MAACDIALAQYRLGKLPSKLDDAITMLERLVELDVMYEGKNSTAAKEHQRLCLQLKQGNVP